MAATLNQSKQVYEVTIFHLASNGLSMLRPENDEFCSGLPE